MYKDPYGFIRLKIWGQERLRLVNMAAFHKIVLYDLKYKEKCIYAGISIKDIRLIFELSRKTDAFIKIISGNGFYFFAKHNRFRKTGFIAAVFAFLMLYIMSLFVWGINFEGNKKYTDSFLMDFLRQRGYTAGKLSASLNCEELEKAIRNELDDVTWVSARIEGTRLVVEINENEVCADKEKEKCSKLIAGKTGIIDSIVTRSGMALVEEGDFVKKGDILVTGTVPVHDEFDGFLYNREENADADVWIIYDCCYRIKINRVQKKRIYTENRKYTDILIGGFRIGFSSGKALKQTEVVEQQSQLVLFDNLYLPIYLEEKSVRKYDSVYVSCTDETLNKQANEIYRNYMHELKKIGVEIIENNVTIDNGSVSYIMNCSMKLRKNAAEGISEHEYDSGGN